MRSLVFSILILVIFIRHLRPLLILLSAFAMPGQAASLFGDSFDFAFFDDGATIGTASGTADAGTLRDIDTVLGFAPGTTIEVNWVDDDSVDVSFFGGGLSGINLGYTLSSLDFSMSGGLTPIAGVSFNRADSDVDDFIGDTSIGQPPLSAFSAPDLAFTDTSFTATFASFDSILIGDGLRLRYDIRFATPPGSVPLPASGLLLIVAVAATCATRRRKSAP